MCRQRMTVLLLYFSESERNTADLEEVERRNLLIESVRDYNRRYSGIFFVSTVNMLKIYIKIIKIMLKYVKNVSKYTE